MELDWLNASVQERKILYRFVKQLADERGLSLALVLEAACGVRHTGIGYEDNFRAGKVSRRRANKIYLWLRDTSPARADDVDAEITAVYNSPQSTVPWEDFISAHGVFRGLKLESAELLERQIVSVRKDRPEQVQASVPIMNPFVLLYEEPRIGYAAALQWFRGSWLPLPLETSAMTTILDNLIDPIFPYRRSERLPKLSPGDPENRKIEPHFREDSEVGLWRFVLIVGQANLIKDIDTVLTPGKPLPPESLNRLASRIQQEPAGGWRIYRLNVMFVSW